MTIDTQSLSLVFFMIVLLQTVGTCLYLRQFRDFPGVRYFLYGNLVTGVAALLLITRYWNIEAASTVFVCNLLLLLGVSLLYVGMARFIGKHENMVVLLAVPAVFILSFAYFTFFNDSMMHRIIIYSACFCVFTGIGVKELLLSKTEQSGFILRVMGGMLLLAFLGSAVRIVVAVFGLRPAALNDPAFLQTWLFIGGAGIAVIWTFMLVLMLGERAISEKNSVQARMRLIYDAIPEMICISELDTGRLAEANQKFFQTLGMAPEEALDRLTTDIGFWDGEETRRDFVARIRRDGKVDNFEIPVRKKDGKSFVGLMSSNPILLRGKTYMVSIIRDIDERKRLENELELQARTDTLTGIGNRGHFLETVRHEISHSESTGSQSVFLMLDIDHFKRINDNYGHQLGDNVIRMVAQATKAVLRTSDILGRIGGDEFGVLLVNTDAAATEKLAEKIRRKVECLELDADADIPVYITVSVGLSKYRPGEDTVEELIARADKALYQAKEEGRNRVVSNW